MTEPARWWETGEQSIEVEVARFAEADLGFSLDEQLLNGAGVVVFRGELRHGDERCEATVVYPPAFAAGRQPVVYAPEIPIGRHRRHDGLLCLDHTVFGERAPMTGAEAVQRAEELWTLSVDDPAALRAQEADAPDPQGEAYHFERGSSALLFDADVTGSDSGVIRLGATTARPLRASMVGLAVAQPAHTELEIAPENRLFSGEPTVCGRWRRIDAPPPGPDAETAANWARESHPDLVEEALRFGHAHRVVTKTNVPALVGFVFPDEGPERDEWHDAWLLLAFDNDEKPRLIRVADVQDGDQWTRQPQLSPLGDKRVAIVGLGALGSQIAALLGRAGLGAFFLVDPDLVTPGIVVRHQLGFHDIGFSKVEAMQHELARINPYSSAEGVPLAYGDARSGWAPEAMQQANDAITEKLATCDLIVNATVDTSSEYYISSVADHYGLPVIHVAVSSGAWGARVLLQRPGTGGCLECLARHQETPTDLSPQIPAWSEDPTLPEIVERGCGQSTFAGPGFELTSAAAAAARTAVQLLLDDDAAYPRAGFDLATLTFRTADSAQPTAEYTALPRHPDCTSCRG